MNKMFILVIGILVVIILFGIGLFLLNEGGNNNTISVSEWHEERDTYIDGQIVEIKGRIELEVETVGGYILRIRDVHGTSSYAMDFIIPTAAYETGNIVIVTIRENRNGNIWSFDIISCQDV